MAPTTVQEERRELWNAILDEVGEQDPDPARAAACSYLLDHLIRSAIPPHLSASPVTQRPRNTAISTFSRRLCVSGSNRRLQIHRHDLFEDVLC